jgi:hypothetical protein
MRKLTLFGISIGLACGGLLPATQASAVSALTGAGAVTPYFGWSDEFPLLDLSGPALTDNGTGLEVYAGDAGGPNAFQLDIDFLNGEPPDHYDGLVLTVALAPHVDYSGVTVRLDFGESYLDLSYDAGHFVSASTFGMPDTSTIPGYTSGGFLDLDGAQMAGVDLETDLTRGEDNPFEMQIQIFGATSRDQIIRFDAFGLCPYGVVMGNNPGYAAAGFQVGPVRPVPEPAAVALHLLGLGIAGASVRKQLFERR